jgi:antibiotic biosynthesis monooxygenase (ABM) superfamily enzyme
MHDNNARHTPPLIARTWTGRIRAEDADAYLEYILEEGVAPVADRPGCLGIQLFRRTEGDVAVFTTISYWESFDAMAAMHPGGADDVRRVHHLDRDEDFLLELPEYAEISELHASLWSSRPDSAAA